MCIITKGNTRLELYRDKNKKKHNPRGKEKKAETSKYEKELRQNPDADLEG